MIDGRAGDMAHASQSMTSRSLSPSKEESSPSERQPSLAGWLLGRTIDRWLLPAR